MKKQVDEKHGTRTQKLCIDSRSSDTRTFNEHLQETHVLPPVTQIKNSETKLPQASSLGRTLQTYSLEAVGDHNFPQFMVD